MNRGRSKRRCGADSTGGQVGGGGQTSSEAPAASPCLPLRFAAILCPLMLQEITHICHDHVPAVQQGQLQEWPGLVVQEVVPQPA